MNKITVYTANTDNYDYERKDILCFTDYNKFTHPRLNAKIYKVLFYQYIKTEWSIWIDSNVFLKSTPEELVELAEDHDICVLKHYRRICVYEEAEECKRQKLDDAQIIDKQMEKYKQNNYPKNNGLANCSLIIRKNTNEVRQLCDYWWSEICTGSWRDQLSFPVVFQDAKIKYLEHRKQEEIYEKYNHLKSRVYLY